LVPAAYAAAGNQLTCAVSGTVGSAGWSFANLVGACRPAGNATTPTAGLLIHPSVGDYYGAGKDGHAYVEGGGGNDVIFGDYGQNDLIGGNSDLFGGATPQQRSDGSNLIFGGDGNRISRSNCGDGTLNATTSVCTTSPNGHAHDSDTIVANNGDIFRLVGASGQIGVPTGSGIAMSGGYLAYNYDVNGYAGATEHIVVRAVRLLDYTPGGPDLASQPGPLVTGAKASNGVGDIGGAPLTTAGCPTTWVPQCQQKGNEIHAEGGDAFIYGGPANDTIFGGGQNDTIVTGYGDNWVSGGYGDACIIAGGARCLANRVSSSYGEPLYGIAAMPAANVSQLISTPGMTQQAMINVNGSLQYTALLSPYNWDPSTPQSQQYRTRFGNNIIYGGWGNDSIHGGPGSDAISGGEAPLTAYTNNYDMNGQLIRAVIESDWAHPFNPGNVLGWNPSASTTAGPGNKFALFDPSDPRRKVMLNGDGSLCKLTPSTGCAYAWILDVIPNEGPMDNKWTPGTGHPSVHATGDDAIFGDLGNSWIVSGPSRSRIYGGWGNDVIDLRANQDVGGGLNNAPVPNPDGSFGTPAWEGLTYGGAGQDIMIAGTGGDRLIDWVGNHNTYLVPFAPFGMPTVSRTLQPGLQQFLYQLSKSDGADQTLGPRYAGDPTRNGEPFGELGVVLQHDAAWHSQVGPPFNPMPANLGGVAIDVRGSAGSLAINSPGTDPPAAANTARISLPSQTDSVGSATLPLQVTGPANAAVTYTVTAGLTSVTGSGTMSPRGTFGAIVNASTMADGILTATATITNGTSRMTLASTTVKNSLGPAAPGASAPYYANLVNSPAYPVTVTGAPGTIATYVISNANGLAYDPLDGSLDIVGSSGSLVALIDVSFIADGPLTVAVSLTNAQGNTTTTRITVTKDTIAPALTVSGVPTTYLNSSTINSTYIYVTGEVGAMATFNLTDGVNTQSDSRLIPSSGQWNAQASFSALNDGPLTLTVTVTDAEGNPHIITLRPIKDTVAPAGSLAIGGTVINGVVATNNATLTLKPSFTDATSGLSQMAFSTDGGTTFGTAQAYAGLASVTLTGADGLYTIAVRVTDKAGNATVVKQSVRLDRSGPATTYSITAPANGGSYDVSQAVTLSYNATDVDNVASLTAMLDGATSLVSGTSFNTESLMAGVHTIVITGKDGLGNVSSTSISFQVHATLYGLYTAVSDGVTRGQVTSSSVASQLQSDLQSAQAALFAGNHTSAKSYLATFVTQVQTGSGTTINAAYASLLVNWAQDLIARL
jgi:Ca2+-binding RTX toxin-like protein